MDMNYFTIPKVNWIEKRRFFFGFSLLIISIGVISLVRNGGPKYGIDFRGGTLLQVKFSQDINIDELRSLLSGAGVEGSTLQRYGPSSDNEVLVGLDVEMSTSSEGLDAGKQTVVRVFGAHFGVKQEGKVDFNDAGAETVAQYLTTRDPLNILSGGGEGAVQSYRDLAADMVDFKNKPSQGGLLVSFTDLAKLDGITPEILEALEKDFYLSGFAIRSTEIVGPKIGAELRQQALWVVGAGLAAMLVYIWFRFELIYGLAAVLAVFHDVLITVGLLSLLEAEITLPVVAALLTLVGYSMNDTIVVFDRIRENLKGAGKERLGSLINQSINQTLRRTMLTSGFTLLAVLSLFLFGGEVIHGFATTILIGVIVGTYSSVAVASPILLLAPEKITSKG